MTNLHVPSGKGPAVSNVRLRALPNAASASRFFFPVTAAVFLILTAIGFGPYYTKGMAFPNREVAPPLKTIVLLHAMVMSAWMIVLMVQPMLIFARKYRWHMAVGKVGVVIAGLVVVSGLVLAIRSTQVTPAEARIWGLPPQQFFIVPFTSVLFFGGFVALAIAYRAKPHIHRAMIMVATLSIMSAAVSRIEFLNNVYVGTVWERLLGPFFITMVLAVVLVAARWVVTQKFDRVFASGVAILIALSLAVWQAAPTAAWIWFASLFA